MDIFADERGIIELTYRRIETSNTHGTGCTLAAGIAAELAKQVHAGQPVDTLAAVRAAREYLASVMEASASLKLGRGERGPLNHARADWASITAPKTSQWLWEDSRVVTIRKQCGERGHGHCAQALALAVAQSYCHATGARPGLNGDPLWSSALRRGGEHRTPRDQPVSR